MKARWIAVICAVVALPSVAGCSGVPSSSSPQVVRTVANRVAPAAVATLTPPPGADQRTIVSTFLQANLGEDAQHTAARAFLTPDARSKWSDKNVTVVDSFQIGVVDLRNNTVTVNATPLGALDQRGIYTPTLQGDGVSATPVPYNFTTQKVNGEWRISALPPGLLVAKPDFQSLYQARRIYFLDSTQRKVVPDLRYSALTGQTLVSWLLDQLLNGPLLNLQSAVSSDVPAQTTKPQATFDGRLITVDLPGISQSNVQTLQRLAAQLAFTFQIEADPLISITDRTRPVSIPGVPATFSAASFQSYLGSGLVPTVYYLHNGSLVDDSGNPVTGPVSNTKNLTSVALSPGVGTAAASAMTVAGTVPVAGFPGQSQLVYGPAAIGLKTVPVEGTLSRPSFAPGTTEVWVGEGAKLVRVSADGSVTTVATTGAPAGNIRSLAFSPDGVRLALIIASPDGTSEIWLGAVVRSGKDVRVDGLTQVTPPGLLLTDVAWNNLTTMYTVGRNATTGTIGIWSVQSDGSGLSSRPTLNLPGAPDSITAAQNASPWVSSAQAVWVQRYNSWSPPGPGTETVFGTSPTYLQ